MPDFRTGWVCVDFLTEVRSFSPSSGSYVSYAPFYSETAGDTPTRNPKKGKRQVLARHARSQAQGRTRHALPKF